MSTVCCCLAQVADVLAVKPAAFAVQLELARRLYSIAANPARTWISSKLAPFSAQVAPLVSQAGKAIALCLHPSKA